MTNIKPVILFLLLTSSIHGLYAQMFNPVNGAAYPVEFTEWTLNGDDKLYAMRPQLRSGIITCNSETTIVNFGGALYKAAYTFYTGDRCEVAVKTVFLQKSVFAIGRIERYGSDFSIFLSIPGGTAGKDIVTVARGKINQQGVSNNE